MMNDPLLLTVLPAMLLAGLAGSLHCIGMCGPILLAFSGAMRRGGDAAGGARPRRFASDFLWYHAGRIWTYGVLGFLAGLVGQSLRHGSALMGWQRVFGIAAGAAVVIVGLALLGVVPGLRLDKAGACGIKKITSNAWLAALLRSGSAWSRLLLGAAMGLLPCGLVYAMLAVVAALPSPAHAALGMVAFGVGTVPSLSAVLATAHLMPARWRATGTRIAAVFVIATGVWVGFRGAGQSGCAHCAAAAAAAQVAE
jgi:sulfite exporter TauE/SafE